MTSSTPLLFPDHPQYWFETMRMLGHTSFGGSEVGEVLATSASIAAGDQDSWYDAWLQTADRVAEGARQDSSRGRLTSAREGFLRAANYYRNADFFLHADPHDPRVRHAYRLGVRCFEAAIAISRPFEEAVASSITPVQIPYEGQALRGYLYRAAQGSDERRPTIVMHNGFDGSAEEMHFFGAEAAAERGFHVLTFDGPGQPAAVHDHGLTFRPDWENVVGPVLDFLLAEHGDIVDSDRIALLGVSLGGVLAPRAAAFEPRIAAVVCNDGVYDALGAVEALLGLTRAEMEARWHDPAFSTEVEAAAAEQPTLRWALDHGLWVMGAADAAEFVRTYAQYHLLDGVAERISCPVLVCEAASDLFFAGDETSLSQPRQLMAHLSAPATLMTFTSAEGADAHCHVGAQRLAAGRMLDWLAETFAADPSDPGAPARSTAVTPQTPVSSPAHAVLMRSIELLAAMDLDGYVDLFAEDAVIEFPYAPPDRPRRLDDPSSVRDYVMAIGAAVTIESFPSLVVHHLTDPHSIVAEVALHGTAVESGAPYDVQYVWILEERDGRITRFRDYWTPTQTAATTGHAAGEVAP